jgi:hypothetical protein
MKQYSKYKPHNIICIQKNQVPIPIFEMDIFCFSEVSLKVAKPAAYPTGCGFQSQIHGNDPHGKSGNHE